MRGTPASSGPDWPVAAAPGDRPLAAMAPYAHTLPFLLWAVEGVQTTLGMQRDMMDLARGVFRQQQDAMIAAMLRGLDENKAEDRSLAEGGFAGLAQWSLAAFDRMAAAVSAANDPGRRAAMQGSAAGGSVERR